MNRFAFASSIVLSTLALAACGDDTTSSGAGGAGGTSSTSDVASSGSPASSNASSASSGTPASSSGGDGGGDVTSVASSGAGGEGGAPGVGGAGAGGDTGVGGNAGTGECAPACEAQDFALADEACQNCAIGTAQGACGAQAQACLTAGEGPDDVEDCTTCGEIVQGGDPANLCESNQDEAAALLTCVCEVCG